MPPLSPANEATAEIAASGEENAGPVESDRLEKEKFLARVLAAMNGGPRSGNLASNNSSGSSLNSTLSGSAPLARPPKPPASQARKQLRLLPKQREQSPVLSNGHTTRSTLSHQHTTNKYTLKSTGGNAGSSTLSSSLLGNKDFEIPYEVSLKLPLNPPTGADSDRHRLVNRSPSPALSVSSRCSTQSQSSISNFTSNSRLQTPPRRVFPQSYTRGSGGVDPYEMRQLESSPVVFDGNLSFVLGCQKQPVYQSMRASPSFEDPRTSSAYLSEKIQNFLKRTDHVQEEWTAMSRRTRRINSNSGRAGGSESRCTTPGSTCSGYDDYDTISLIERQRERNSMERCGSVGRTRSSQNILTKAFQLAKQLPHTPTSRGNSVARDRESSVATISLTTGDNDDDDDRTIREEDDEVSVAPTLSLSLTQFPASLLLNLLLSGGDDVSSS